MLGAQAEKRRSRFGGNEQSRLSSPIGVHTPAPCQNYDATTTISVFTEFAIKHSSCASWCSSAKALESG